MAKVITKEHNLIVCEHCLRAIESREGSQDYEPLDHDKYEIEPGEDVKCEWCDLEFDPDFLYELK